MRYEGLVKLCIEHIINPDREVRYNIQCITTIDNGDYQGTQLFVIPMDTYQPCEYEYIMTYANYGSCSGCDTLLNIQYDSVDEDTKVNDYMTLCKDLVCNITEPFNKDN